MVEPITKNSIKKGDLFRITKKHQYYNGKVLAVGVIVEVINPNYAYSQYLDGSSYKVYSTGRQPRAYYDELYYSHLERVTEKEIKEMNRPSESILNVVGSGVFTKVSSVNRDKKIQEILTATPTAEIAVYNLQGVATTEPVEVKFTFARELAKG